METILSLLWWVVWVLVAIIGVVSIVLIARKLRRSRAGVVGLIPTWPAWADRQMVGLAVGVVAIFLLLQVALPELIAAVVVAAGWFAIILVVVAVIALLTLLTGKQRAVIIWGIAALLLVIAFRGPSCAPGDTACIEARQQAAVAEDMAKAEVQAALEQRAKKARSVSAECPGRPETFDISETEPAKIINPSSCQLRWKIRTGCVRAFNRSGEVISEKVCGGGEAEVPPGLYSLAALDGPAKVHRTECSRRATGDFLNSCE